MVSLKCFRFLRDLHASNSWVRNLCFSRELLPARTIEISRIVRSKRKKYSVSIVQNVHNIKYVLYYNKTLQSNTTFGKKTGLGNLLNAKFRNKKTMQLHKYVLLMYYGRVIHIMNTNIAFILRFFLLRL